MDVDSKRKALARLRRAGGQVEGIRRMIDQDRELAEVLVQVAAVRAALGKVARLLIEEHMRRKVDEALGGGDERERERTVTELLDLLERHAPA